MQTQSTAPLSPQASQIYQHLKVQGSISNVEAQAVYRCRALPRRISDIEQLLGVRISRRWNRDMTGQRYVRYYLES